MTSQTNQPSDMGREQVPNTSEEQVTDALTTVGVKRGEFPDGAATVLVLDHFERLHAKYGRIVPQEANLLFVRDTTTAQQAMHENPAIGVVIAQGLSRKVTNSVFDRPATTLQETLAMIIMTEDYHREGKPVNDWLDSPDHTLAFLKFLQQQEFSGLVQVVSRTLESYEQAKMLDLKGLRVQYMDKQRFFDGTFTSKVDELWERIARYENYERKMGRRFGHGSGIALDMDNCLAKVVQPYPSEDKLFKRWADATRYSNNCPEAMACEEVLTWLENLKLAIKAGDVRSIYDCASMLPEHRQSCDCFEVNDPTSPYYWTRLIHWLHDDINQAVWDILDMAGLMEWMRLELEFDLACHNAEFDGFGRHARHSLGLQLREFFQPEGPSQQWLSWRVERR